MRYHFLIAIILSLILLTSGALSVPAFSEAISTDSDSGYKVIHYTNNTIYIMNPDGSEREEILFRPDVLGLIALNDGRILIHSAQYDGQALEILNPETKAWVLVEFIEGTFPNIDISDDASVVAYETRRIPIPIEGDGIWLYDVGGQKTHVKISASAFSIESILIHDNQLYMLYHELDLIRDDAGLFQEKIPIKGSGRRDRNRMPHGTRLLLDGGYILGFAYLPTGRALELKHLTNDAIHFTKDIPGGDIIMNRKGFFMGRSPVLCFQIGQLQDDGDFHYETKLWYMESGDLWDVEVEGLHDLENFNWSPDGWLYFSACYKDPSGEKSDTMLFRYHPRRKDLELVSVKGGMVSFAPQ